MSKLLEAACRNLILALVGIIPVWPHSRSWGYAPGGVVGVVVIILVILLLMGRI